MSYEPIILIVDDEPRGRKTLQTLFMGQPYRVAFAGDGSEALAKAAELTPDVILLDVMMPDMDGFEVCRRLRANPALADVPVIMVTALDDRDSRLQGIEAGADDFVSKPIDRIELRTRVQTITKLNRYRRLLTERTKFEWVVEQADDGYVVINNEDELSYANPQARQFLGLVDEEPISETFLTLARKRYQLNPLAAWSTWPNLSESNAPMYLVQPASSTGEAFWLQVDLMKMEPQSESGQLVRLRDITAEVHQQRLTWTFHAQVSHKLRTPLAILNGFLELIEEDDVTDFPLEQKLSMLSIINKNTLQLREKITQVFKYLDAPDLVRTGQGQAGIAEIPAIVSQLETNLALHPISVTCRDSFTPLEQAQLPFSGQSLSVILEEILKNAQKFHPGQSPLIAVTLSGEAQSITIQVADDGLTLSPEQLAKIWQPYYQAERYFSGNVPGMGLGLSMVASLVWGVGGTCRAYNRVDGPGLVVELTLPLLENALEVEAV